MNSSTSSGQRSTFLELECMCYQNERRKIYLSYVSFIQLFSKFYWKSITPLTLCKGLGLEQQIRVPALKKLNSK
jgi:hypothetical protein